MRTVFRLSDYERDPARYMQRLLSEATRRFAEQAEQSRKAGEQMAGYEAWGRNRGLTYIPPKYKPEPSDAA